MVVKVKKKRKSAGKAAEDVASAAEKRPKKRVKKKAAVATQKATTAPAAEGRVKKKKKKKTRTLQAEGQGREQPPAAPLDKPSGGRKVKVAKRPATAEPRAPRKKAAAGKGATAERSKKDDSSDEGSFFTNDESKKASLTRGDDAGDDGHDRKKKQVIEDFKVFVGNMPWTVSEEAVRAHFAVYGAFARFDMPQRNGKSDGSAFIYYKTQAAMDKALEMDGQFFEGRTIKVKRATAQNRTKHEGEPKDKQLEREKKNKLTVFIGGLPFDTDLAVLKKDFEECGEVDSMRTLKNDDGKFKGTAFVVYKTDAAVQKALEWHNADYGGRCIIVRRAGEGKGESKGGKGDSKGKGKKWNADHNRTVFIGSLSRDLEVKQLESDFGECGAIECVRIVKDGAGQSKGAAFIVFRTVDGVKQALEWDGEYYGERRIKVSMAQSKDKD